MRKTQGTALLACVAISLLLVCATEAAAQNLEVKTHTLKNGMKVLVQEDHSIPNVAMYTFYRIGSRNERPGTTGLSHFFEHMMFNGAKKYGPRQFDIVMEANGGSNNAYTSKDVTVYQDWFPRSALELIFDLEADRIENLGFDPEMIQSERGVVASERRTSVDNNNFGILFEHLWATAYMAHSYKWPVVGWMSDIESWTLDDLKQHFRMGYSPSNATLLLVGDVKAEEIFALAEKYFAGIAAHDPPSAVRTREPDQQGERRVVVKKFAQLPILMIGYHVPATADEDYYALRALQTVLFRGQSSRMYQRLVDKDQLALSISGGFGFAFDPTLFTITAQPRAGITPEAVEKAVYEELEKVKTAAVKDEEIQKAKNILVADFYRQMKTISGKANTLGSYEVYFGDYRKLLTAAADFEKVKKEDLQRVAQRYFGEKNRTVATLVPEKPPAKPGTGNEK